MERIIRDAAVRRKRGPACVVGTCECAEKSAILARRPPGKRSAYSSVNRMTNPKQKALQPGADLKGIHEQLPGRSIRTLFDDSRGDRFYRRLYRCAVLAH
jgi:hypothetical protein